MFVSQEHHGGGGRRPGPAVAGPPAEPGPASRTDHDRALAWLRRELAWEDVLGRLRRAAGVPMGAEATPARAADLPSAA
jgi:hypothetical protein